MGEDANDDGADPASDIKNQNEGQSSDDTHKVEKLTGKSGDDLDEAEE